MTSLNYISTFPRFAMPLRKDLFPKSEEAQAGTAEDLTWRHAGKHWPDGFLPRGHGHADSKAQTSALMHTQLHYPPPPIAEPQFLSTFFCPLLFPFKLNRYPCIYASHVIFLFFLLPPFTLPHKIQDQLSLFSRIAQRGLPSSVLSLRPPTFPPTLSPSSHARHGGEGTKARPAGPGGGGRRDQHLLFLLAPGRANLCPFSPNAVFH